MRHISFLTGSRGEWGYIRPIIRLVEEDPELSYSIIATNMHLLPEFGLSVRQIERDGFSVAEKLYMTLDGYNSVTMVKSLGNLLQEIPGALLRLRPDILVVAGDRGEQLMGAIAASHMGIVVAHVQAGELSGNIDGVMRHAITKIAHIHFAANREFAARVIRMGEQPFRVFETGAPQLDDLKSGSLLPETELRDKYHIDNGHLILAVQHPVTEEEGLAGTHIRETLAAIKQIGWQTIMIYPNTDAGSESIRSELAEVKMGHVKLFRNVAREDYLGLMKLADVIVGNSSSAILEAPTFGLPAVNIGRRQNGRPQAANVINCGHHRAEIVSAIQKATTPEFRISVKNIRNPYGDGNSSGRILKILKEILIDSRLLNKEMAY
jgi:UDP-hydrolysing UDP-N-acetyl-D-glucosamine 2-epimerase